MIRGGEAERGLELFVDTVSGAGVWKRSSATFRRMTLDNAMTLVGQVADQPPALALSELRSIDLPSLILNGERSPQPFPATAEALAAALPRQAATHPGCVPWPQCHPSGGFQPVGTGVPGARRWRCAGRGNVLKRGRAN